MKLKTLSSKSNQIANHLFTCDMRDHVTYSETLTTCFMNKLNELYLVGHFNYVVTILLRKTWI